MDQPSEKLAVAHCVSDFSQYYGTPCSNCHNMERTQAVITTDGLQIVTADKGWSSVWALVEKVKTPHHKNQHVTKCYAGTTSRKV